jgi:hypothetical protein
LYEHPDWFISMPTHLSLVYLHRREPERRPARGRADEDHYYNRSDAACVQISR